MSAVLGHQPRDNGGGLRLLDQLLLRATNVGRNDVHLRLHASLKESQCPVMDLLHLRWDMLATLDLHVSSSDLRRGRAISHGQWRELSRALCEPAPALHTLVLQARSFAYRIADRAAEKLYLRSEVLGGGQFPATLKTLVLRDVLLRTSNSRPYLAFRGVKRFSYTASWKRVLTDSHLRFILESMPALEELWLDFHKFVLSDRDKGKDNRSSEGRESDGAKELVPLKVGKLRRVDLLRLRSGMDKMALMLQNVPHIEVHETTMITSGASVLDVWPAAELRLTLSLNHLRIQGTGVATGPGSSDTSGTDTEADTIDEDAAHKPVRSFTLHTVRTDWPFGGALSNTGTSWSHLRATHAAHVVSLALAESEWDAFLGLPPLPALRELRIVLSACCEILCSDVAGIFASPLAPHTRPLPSLQLLALCSGTRYWAAGDADCDAERMMGLRLCFVHDTLQESGYITQTFVSSTIALTDVESLVRALLPPGSRLPVLELAGIDAIADPDPGAAWCRLLDEVVDEVQCVKNPVRRLVEDCRQPDPWGAGYTPDFVREVRDSFRGSDLPCPMYLPPLC